MSTKKHKTIMEYQFILIFAILGVLGWAGHSNAATIYVDYRQGYCTSCTAGSDTDYDVATRNCGSGSATVYSTIQAAVNAVATGDTIHMRGGTYSEYDIVIPNNIEGPAWTTLSSYPGEWAILNGGGIDDAAITHIVGYGNSSSYQKRNLANQTSYWKFERFEVTGYASAFWFSGGPQWYRYLYIHDNTANTALAGAIFVTLPRDCIIEYCYFYNNDQASETNSQYGHILFDADYFDDEDPDNTNPDIYPKHNVIRYNYLDDSTFGIHYKNQQRFGIDVRNPAVVANTYGNYGDDVHHNIILNSSSYTINSDWDNLQIHNNIVSGTLSGHYGDNAITYNKCFYNNTVLAGGTSVYPGAFGCISGKSENGNSMATYYDTGGTQVIHPHEYLYNNIVDSLPTAYVSPAFMLSRDMPANTSNPLLVKSDYVVERNLIHNDSDSHAFMLGRNYDAAYTGCDVQEYTVSDFNSCSATWRGVGSVTNWDVDTAGLFLGSSGANQYKTNSSFIISGATTIANGGYNAEHPYLDGVTIPLYVGATNPNDNGWVDGVLGLATYSNLQNAGSGDPTWIEGSGQTGDTTAPGSPSGLSVS